MNASVSLDDLNQEQRLSVTLDDNMNALILAGAGSGKTRVLIHRIHYLVSEKNYHLDSILAVTFTNKAANEMRERLGRPTIKTYRANVGRYFSFAGSSLVESTRD